MSLLLLSADPGTPWTRTAESRVVWLSSYLLDLIERTILILELRNELRGRGILNRKICKSKPSPAAGLELLKFGLLGRRLIH